MGRKLNPDFRYAISDFNIMRKRFGVESNPLNRYFSMSGLHAVEYYLTKSL